MVDIPERMRAVFPSRDGDRLEVRTVDTPRPRPGQVLIKVAAAGVNRPDILQRRGLYPPPAGAPDSLGLEVSGFVAAAPGTRARFRGGEAVCALLAGGGYAEYALADEGSVLPTPAALTTRDAAAVPEAVFTVWANVFEAGNLQPGETFLVHGGASGIGSTAIQMAAAHGARVFATSGRPEKVEFCARLGAARSINYRSEDFAAVVREAGGADVILDMVGGDYVARNLACLKEGGRLVQIAFQDGSRVKVDLMRLMLKRLTLTGSTLRSRSVEEKARIAATVYQTVWPWIEDRLVRPVVDTAFALEDAADAHRRMEAGDHMGKLVLEP